MPRSGAWLLGAGAAALLLIASSSAQAATPSPEESPRWPHPPLAGKVRLGSPFGWRVDPVRGGQQHHDGLDLPAPAGTPVYAPEAGVVDRVDRDGVGRGVSTGNAVFLRAESRRWAFFHLSSVEVAVGARVTRGQRIGAVGSTGKSTGAHLHLQAWDSAGKLVDPVVQFAPDTFAPRRSA